MSGQKWGESFLKSGLPLEHLTLLTLKSLGWFCEPHLEYMRLNREGNPVWFERDMVAYSPRSLVAELILLIECKYHDQDRSWFFLPCETEDHLAQYEALSAGANLYTDGNVVHSAPYECLANPDSEQLLALAPKSVWGVTVSRSGVREPNSFEDAVKQVTYGFAPFCLESLYPCNRPGASVIPVVVTSAQLFRVRPSVTDLEQIRDAASPTDVADEIPWTWYYHAPNNDLLGHNMDEINSFKRHNRFASRKAIADRLVSLWGGPHWIAVANLKGLAAAVRSIQAQFEALPKSRGGERMIAQIQRARWKGRKARKGAEGQQS